MKKLFLFLVLLSPALAQQSGAGTTVGGSSGFGSTVFWVTGTGQFATIASTYAYAQSLSIMDLVIYDFNLNYSANSEVMYCTPWTNDGSEGQTTPTVIPTPTIYLGPGILYFSNTQQNGQPCASSRSTFGPAKHMLIQGVAQGINTIGGATANAGTIIQPLVPSGMVPTTGWTTAASSNCPSATAPSCLMPLVVVGDWTGTSYVQGAMLKNVNVDCAWIPGCIAIEMYDAQENSGTSDVGAKNATQALYWHSTHAQNSIMTEFYDEGCTTPAALTTSPCPIDSKLSHIDWDNVPSARGFFGGTINPGNNAMNFAVSISGSGVSTSSGVVTVNLAASSHAATASPPTVACSSGSGTTYVYAVVPLQTFTKVQASVTGTVSCGSPLSTSVYTTVPKQSTMPLTNAYWCKIYRTMGGATTGYIFTVPCTSDFNDIGYVASSTDTTPSAADNSGLITGDWVCWSGTNATSGCWGPITMISSTQFQFNSSTSLSCTSTSNCGNFAIVPQVALAVCVGNSTCIDNTPEPMIAGVYNLHFEHAGNGLALTGPGTGVILDANGLNTVSSTGNADLYNLINIPSVAIGGLAIKGTQGAATNSLYADSNVSRVLATSVHYDNLESYGENSVAPNGGTVTQTIASGTASLTTSSIASGACSSASTATATGAATTDSIIFTPNQDPTGLTGYQPATTGSLYIWGYPTSGQVNFKVCNNTGAASTPAALTVNWRVVR